MARIAALIGSSPRDCAANLERMGVHLLPGGRGQISITTFTLGVAGSPSHGAGLLRAEIGRTGAPPPVVSVTAGGPVDVALDGAVHNRDELSARLALRAPIEDSTLIVHGYRSEGIGFFRAINGEFACLLYDPYARRLYAVRDRFGTHLLFWAAAADGLVFASEIKALFAQSAVARRPDWDSVDLYAFTHYRYAYASERTFFEGVQLVPPNSIWSWTFGSPAPRAEPLWDFHADGDAGISDADACAEFHSRLDRSLRLRLDSLGEQPCFLLSGGLDSPTIAALAAARSSGPIASFSIGYEHADAPHQELSYDERPFIEPTVAMHQMEWSAVLPTPEDFPAVFDEMVHRHDEPISSPTWYAHWMLVKAIAADGYCTAFGGDGGDHALAGLYDDIPYYLADLCRCGDVSRFEHELACWEQLHDHPVFRKNRRVWDIYAAHCFDWSAPGRITGFVWDEGRMRGIWPYEAAAGAAMRRNGRSFPDVPSVSSRYLISKLWQDLLYTSSPPSTRAEDINLATFGVGLRSVFMDADFMTFCWSLPGHLMIRDGLMKFLMREAMNGRLPEVVRLKAQHVGLNAPANVWFRGPLRWMIEATVESKVWNEVPVFDRVRLRTILAEHSSGAADHMMFLWRVLSLERWLRRWGFAS